MITTLTDDGNFSWDCHRCGIQAAHISHEEVEWIDEHTVGLPACPCCANNGVWSRTFIKAHFTAQELTAPNMIDHVTGQPTESHKTAHRHMAFADQMKAQGKEWGATPPVQEDIPNAEEIGGIHEATRGL